MHTPIYGFIGLGLGGDASKNFKTKDGSIFSIQIDNSTGMGDLIFGDDTSRYNSSRVPASLPCDENWSLETESIKLGNTTKNFASKLVFDLQKDGIRLPHRYLSTEAFWWESFRNQFNLTKIQISYDSIYLYNGKLSALPFLTFNLSNGASLSVPPVAYTKPYNETTYQILIDSLSYDEKSNYTVLGWRILAQHYTIFKQNSTGNTITMYPLYTHVIEEDSSHNEFTMLYIVFMVTLAAAIFASLVNCFKRKERTGRDEVGLELKNHMDVMGGIAPIRFDD